MSNKKVTMPPNSKLYELLSGNHFLPCFNLKVRQELKALTIVTHALAGCALAVAIPSSAQAFNFTTGAVGGSCESLLTAFNPSTNLGDQKLPSCQTADGFGLVANGGNLQAKRNGLITNVGVTDIDWSNLFGACMVGIISPCNGNTGEGEIGYREALKVLLPSGGAVLKSLDLSFRFSWDSPSDVVFELAALLSDQSQTTGTLTFTSSNEAIWNWAGTTQTTTLSSGGYRLSNPFDNTAIAAVILTAPNLSGEDGYVDTKYGLIGAEAGTAAAVPEPSSFLGLLLAGIAGIKLRRRIGKGHQRGLQSDTHKAAG